MIWNKITETLEDYFDPEYFHFVIHQEDDPSETECAAVVKMDKGLREQQIRMYLEDEDSIKFIRINSPLVSVERCSQDQLIRLLEQNITWINTSVGVVGKVVVYTTVLSVREFEADSACLGDAIVKLARRADQMETLLFGRDHK